MLNLSVSANRSAGAALVGALRDIPASVLPYAGAIAATRVAKIAASQTLPAEMRRVFDRPTNYALNSMRVVPATKDKPTARVFVKDDASGRGVKPENFLLPEVEGGGRKEKRFERSLRYSGLLGAGERVMPGRDIELDANGGIPSALIRSITVWAKAGAGRKKKRTRATKAENPRGFFLFGQPGARVRGVAQRSGAIVMPLLIFTKTQPVYRKRLDFSGVVERTALDHFPAEFDRAAREILSRNR